MFLWEMLASSSLPTLCYKMIRNWNALIFSLSLCYLRVKQVEDSSSHMDCCAPGIGVMNYPTLSGQIISFSDNLLKSSFLMKAFSCWELYIFLQQASKKKVYMLYNLQPDRSVTGGAWYSDQDFESEFVEVLNQQCFKFLQSKVSAKVACHFFCASNGFLYKTGARQGLSFP